MLRLIYAEAEIARQLGEGVDDITNQKGYKKIGSWATLVLIAIGFIPGIGDGIKSIGRRGIRYLDNNRILKKIGEFLGENIIAPILNRVGDITAPIVDQIKNAIRRKLDEAQQIARQLGEGVDNVIDDVTGRPQVATEGAGNVPSRMETEPPVRGNEPSRMEGNQSGRINASRKYVDDIINNPLSLVGKSAEDIAEKFNDAGYEAFTQQTGKKGTSGKAIQVRIKHPEITNIQVHPGGGRHTSEGIPYWKISTNTKGKIWVIPKSFRGVDTLGGKAVYYE